MQGCLYFLFLLILVLLPPTCEQEAEQWPPTDVNINILVPVSMLCYVAKGKRVADKIRVTHKLTLRQQSNLKLITWSEGSKYNHKSPRKWKREAEKRESETAA